MSPPPKSMQRKLRMKCFSCGQWNRVPVNKIFLEQPSPEPRVQVLIPMYEPLKTQTCTKCKKVIARPNELIKIRKVEKEEGQNATT